MFEPIAVSGLDIADFSYEMAVQYEAQVSVRIVFRWRSPAENYLTGRIVTTLDIVEENFERGTESVLRILELAELLVSREVTETFPVIALADVQRVVVANCASNHER